jgi:hypothetical protein
MIDEGVLAQADAVLAQCRAAGVMVATVESCTGGLIAAALTAISGSSDVVDRGFVTYSNAAKSELVGVPARLIAEFGAVSEPVARDGRGRVGAVGGGDRGVGDGDRRAGRRECGEAGGAGVVRAGADGAFDAEYVAGVSGRSGGGAAGDGGAGVGDDR